MVSNPLPVHGSTGSLGDDTVQGLIYVVTHLTRGHRLSHPVLLVSMRMGSKSSRMLSEIPRLLPLLPHLVQQLPERSLLPMLPVLPPDALVAEFRGSPGWLVEHSVVLHPSALLLRMAHIFNMTSRW